VPRDKFIERLTKDAGSIQAAASRPVMLSFTTILSSGDVTLTRKTIEA